MTTAAKVPNYTPSLKSPELASRERLKVLEDQLHDRIAERAFQFFEREGRVDGQDWAHWFQAETDVLALKPEIQESTDTVMVIARLPNIRPEDIEIGVGEHEAIIRTTTEQVTKTPESKERKELFQSAQWPWEVDPATATASLRDAVLTLVAKKRSPAQAATAHVQRS